MFFLDLQNIQHKLTCGEYYCERYHVEWNVHKTWLFIHNFPLFTIMFWEQGGIFTELVLWCESTVLIYYYAYIVILTWKKITCFQGCWLHILWNGLWTSIIPWFNSWGRVASNLPSTRLTTCRCMGWFSSTICITTVLTRSAVDKGSPPRCWCPRVTIKVPVCKFLVYWKSWRSQITSYNVGLRWTAWQ